MCGGGPSIIGRVFVSSTDDLNCFDSNFGNSLIDSRRDSTVRHRYNTKTVGRLLKAFDAFPMYGTRIDYELFERDIFFLLNNFKSDCNDK